MECPLCNDTGFICGCERGKTERHPFDESHAQYCAGGNTPCPRELAEDLELVGQYVSEAMLDIFADPIVWPSADVIIQDVTGL